MATTTSRRLTDEERARRRAHDRARLEQAARELLTSEGWQRWIKVRARNGLAKYSLGNQLLIAMQAPDAQFVAGFHAWKDLGRRVAKGQHGIRILAPIPIRLTGRTTRVRPVRPGGQRPASEDAIQVSGGVRRRPDRADPRPGVDAASSRRVSRSPATATPICSRRSSRSRTSLATAWSSDRWTAPPTGGAMLRPE